MKTSTILLTLLIVICSVLNSTFSATIFDHAGRRRSTGLKKPLIADRFNALRNDHSKRHINSFRALSDDQLEELRRSSENRVNKYNDDQSNERNIWRSHPQKPDYKGPDTQEAVGL